MTWQFGALRMFGYDVIVADPPWDFENYSAAGTLKGADPHYDVMPLNAIKALRVHELARGDCLLLLWTCGWAIATGQAQEVARAWCFQSDHRNGLDQAHGKRQTTHGTRVSRSDDPRADPSLHDRQPEASSLPVVLRRNCTRAFAQTRRAL
jgi:N6-adenosine-specific RNA methylase IME4